MLDTSPTPRATDAALRLGFLDQGKLHTAEALCRSFARLPRTQRDLLVSAAWRPSWGSRLFTRMMVSGTLASVVFLALAASLKLPAITLLCAAAGPVAFFAIVGVLMEDPNHEAWTIEVLTRAQLPSLPEDTLKALAADPEAEARPWTKRILNEELCRRNALEHKASSLTAPDGTAAQLDFEGRFRHALSLPAPSEDNRGGGVEV